MDETARRAEIAALREQLQRLERDEELRGSARQSGWKAALVGGGVAIGLLLVFGSILSTEDPPARVANVARQ